MTRAIRQPATQLQLLIVLAVVLGGGGIAYGLRHMLIQLAALAILAFHPDLARSFLARAPRGLVALVLATMALPLVQAMPLPPAIWQAMPGRELVIASYAASGNGADLWFSYSLDPVRSLVAFCSTLVPAVMIVIGWALSAEERQALVRAVGLAAFGAFILGAVQITSANTVGMMQDIAPDRGIFYATFSNRNSTGIFFITVALLLLAGPAGQGRMHQAANMAMVLLAVLAVILTQSRSSMVLLVPLAIFALARLVAWRRARHMAGHLAGRGTLQSLPRGAAVVAGAAAGLFFAAIAFSFVTGGRVADGVDRFATLQTDRLENWDDGAFVARRYWPLGAGTGTFDEVFQVDESLEYVSPARAGRAHNDYLELVIESGIIGLAVLLGWFAWLGMALVRRRHDADRWGAYGAMTALVCIALQSILDYPLRNEAMLAVAGVLVVLLLPHRDARAA